jgi:hypothetical protein
MMIAEQRSARLRNAARVSAPHESRSVTGDQASRLIQIALALYLVPALLIVLAVGGVGMIVLAVGRLFTVPVRGSLS